MAQDLSSLEASIKNCLACNLCNTRTQVVFGQGDPDADIMFIGEAPGATEDAKGIPFCGQAGKVLDAHLQNIGLDRNKVYIANILKCRPPNNVNPTPDQIKTCTPILAEQIHLIKPKIIVPLGAFAMKFMIPNAPGITKAQLNIYYQTDANPDLELCDEIRILPMFHPAATLHNPTLKDDLAKSFKKLHWTLDHA